MTTRPQLLIVIGSVVLAAALAVADEPGKDILQQGYTTATLREPVFDSATVEAEARAIDAWLTANYKKLSPEQMAAPREHLYYLIDSRVKDLYTRERRVFPKTHDPVFETLFSWADRLRVYGGGLVYNALRAPGRPEMPPSMKVPRGFTLTLKDNLLEVRSEAGGWSVTVPYYFMIWNINDFTATGGARTQLLALSTGAATDVSPARRSQATLVLMFSPGADAVTVASYWRRRFGIAGDAETVPLGVRGLIAQRALDNSSRLYKEFVTWAEPQGPFVVTYTGIDGTYQWNRPHFLDFLRALKVQQSRPPNSGLQPTAVAAAEPESSAYWLRCERW